MFWVEILLSSCSLVGLYVNLQVKVTEKKDENFQSIFRVGVCALHTLGRHVVKHGLKFEVAGVKVVIAKKI